MSRTVAGWRAGGVRQEALGSDHMPVVADWALPKRRARELLIEIAVVRLFGGRCWLRHAEKLATTGELGRAVAIAEKAEISDPPESRRQDMEEKAPDELVGGEGHDLLLVVTAIVPPSKTHFAILDIEETMVGDRHSVGIATEVIEYLAWPGKRPLGVNHPFLGA